MVNVNKLKGKIVEKGLSVEKVAEIMGIDRSTLYRKLSNSADISIKDADRIVKALNLTSMEGSSIFFSQFVA